MRIQVLQETRSPVQMGPCLNGRLQSHFQLMGFNTQKPAAMWTHLHPLAHQPAHQGCSNPHSCTVMVVLCPPSQSGALCWSPRASSAMHLGTQLTPENHRASHFTGQKIEATKKAHLLDPISPQICICLPAESTALNVSLYSSAFLSKDRRCKTKAAARAFILQNRGAFIISFLLAEEPNCSLERSLPETGEKVPWPPGEVSLEGQSSQAALPQCVGEAGALRAPRCRTRLSAHLEERSAQLQRPIPNQSIFCSTSHIGHLWFKKGLKKGQL